VRASGKEAYYESGKIVVSVNGRTARGSEMERAREEGRGRQNVR